MMSPVLFLSGMFIPIPVLNPLHSPEKSKVCSTRILPAPKIAPASGNLSQLEGSMIILPSSKIPNSGAGPCLESRWSSEAQNRTLFVVCMCMLSYINSVNWYIPRLAMCSLWTLWICKNCNNLVSSMYHVSMIWLGDFVLITWLQLFVGDSLRPPLWYCMWVFLQLSGERWRPPPGQVEKSYMKTVGCTTRAGATRVILDVYQYSAAPFICTQHQLSSSLELSAHIIIAWFCKFFACLQASLLTMMVICPYLQPMAWGRDEKCKVHSNRLTQLRHRLARKSLKFRETLHNTKPTTYCITIKKIKFKVCAPPRVLSLLCKAEDMGPSDHPGVRLWPLQTRFDGPRESFQKFLPGNSHRIHPSFKKNQPGDTTHLCWGDPGDEWNYHQGSLYKAVYDALHKSPKHRVHVCIALPTCAAKKKGPAQTAVGKGSENKLHII